LIGVGGGYIGLRRHGTPQFRRLYLGLLALCTAGVVMALAGYLSGW
jgi:hypothetical protein